jgi:hypothetical protein
MEQIAIETKTEQTEEQQLTMVEIKTVAQQLNDNEILVISLKNT